MTEYSELVKALRSASTVSTAWEKLMHDAAAAIEALQAEVGRLEMRCADCEYASKPWPELEPKRGEWVGVSPMVDTVQCSVCGGQLFSAELKTPYCPYCGAKMEVQDGQ